MPFYVFLEMYIIGIIICFLETVKLKGNEEWFNDLVGASSTIIEVVYKRLSSSNVSIRIIIIRSAYIHSQSTC